MSAEVLGAFIIPGEVEHQRAVDVEGDDAGFDRLLMKYRHREGTYRSCRSLAQLVLIDLYAAVE